MKSKVEIFLDKHSLNADSIDMDYVCDLFIKEMRSGLDGKPSSLAMIPSYCSTDAHPRPGENVIVIDAGGTNLRTCLVTFDESLRPVISDFRKTSMPGVSREVSSREFFSTFADEVERIVDRSDRIGFCFSYAAEILPDHDGVPLMLSKEIKAPEIIGRHLGKELLAELASRGHDVTDKKILILNDTVATLLAAQSQNRGGSYESCIGFILGTGTNTAYVEKSANIGKLDDKSLCGESQIINVESGNMEICLGDLDRRFLDGTKDPGKYMFEKMISGAYLGPLADLIINAAVEEGLFSKIFAERFSKAQRLSTINLNAFLEDSEDCMLYKCCEGNDDDYDTLMEILGSFISRAAKLTAANLASAVLITDFGKDEDHPVLINADGTTFHKTAFLKSYTTEYLEAYLSEKGRRAVLTQIDDSPVIGSAIGALTL